MVQSERIFSKEPTLSKTQTLISYEFVTRRKLVFSALDFKFAYSGASVTSNVHRLVIPPQLFAKLSPLERRGNLPDNIYIKRNSSLSKIAERVDRVPREDKKQHFFS